MSISLFSSHIDIYYFFFFLFSTGGDVGPRFPLCEHGILDWTLECGIKESRLPERILIMDILMFGVSSIENENLVLSNELIKVQLPPRNI